MNKNLEKIKDKLKKLMKKEESARDLGNLQEAEAFASKIQSIMIEYEIEVSELELDENAQEYIVGEEIVDCGELTNRHESSWVVFLYDACAAGNLAKVVVKGKITGLQIYLIGSESSKEFTHYMVHQLVPKLRKLARDEFKKYDGASKRNTYIRSFLRGASVGIKERLMEDLSKQNQEKALMVIDKKEIALKDYIKNRFGNLSSSKARRSSSYDGYASGREAGKNVGIHKGVRGKSGVTAQKYLG